MEGLSAITPYFEHDCDDVTLTDCRELFMAITAAMKKVLSPISETRIIPQDFKKPAARPPAKRLVMLRSCKLGGGGNLV